MSHHKIRPYHSLPATLFVLALLAALLFTSRPAFAEQRLLLILGDSLSAGYNIPEGKDWVSQISQNLKKKNSNWRIHNASTSGMTSSEGLTRLPNLLAKYNPQAVLIELGGNDGLRGLPLDQLQNNLSKMIEIAQAKGAKVILAPIHIPPNYGRRYQQAFSNLYPQLAKKYDVFTTVFLLQKIIDNPALMQADGLHPNTTAQTLIAESMWKSLQPVFQ